MLPVRTVATRDVLQLEKHIQDQHIYLDSLDYVTRQGPPSWRILSNIRLANKINGCKTYNIISLLGSAGGTKILFTRTTGNSKEDS